MLELRDEGCFPRLLAGVNVGLACFDCILAVLAFWQLIRIHSRNSQLGWTRQKVFHLMIGSSNIGYFVYFVITLVATCKGWICWSQFCGFIFMAFPKILFFAAFLLLLSYWVDLCHQSDDEEEDDEELSFQEALLEKTLKEQRSSESHRKCFPLRMIHVRSRQKIVILVTLLVFVMMIVSAVLIWIGMGKNPIDSSVVARVYVDLFATAILLLGGALACYGLLLCLKMRKVRSERASSEMWKVAGLTIVSVFCFTSSAFVAIFTDIPVLYHWPRQHVDVFTSLLLILYYFIGSSIPSSFVLWFMRELPPVIAAGTAEESRIVTFIGDSSAAVHHSQRWTNATSSQNQISRASPI